MGRGVEFTIWTHSYILYIVLVLLSGVSMCAFPCSVSVFRFRFDQSGLFSMGAFPCVQFLVRFRYPFAVCGL